MNKYFKVEYIIVFAAITINVVLVTKYLQVRKQLELIEFSAKSNYTKLQYRIVDNIKILKMSHNEDFFKPDKILTTQGESQDYYNLNDGYYILFNYYGCHDCIDGALKTLKELEFDELRYFGGNFDSLNAWKLFMKDNNLKLENGYYCYGLSSSLVSKEEAPIIINLKNGRIVDCCVIDGSFPVVYYKYFLSK